MAGTKGLVCVLGSILTCCNHSGSLLGVGKAERLEHLRGAGSQRKRRVHERRQRFFPLLARRSRRAARRPPTGSCRQCGAGGRGARARRPSPRRDRRDRARSARVAPRAHGRPRWGHGAAARARPKSSTGAHRSPGSARSRHRARCAAPSRYPNDCVTGQSTGTCSGLYTEKRMLGKHSATHRSPRRASHHAVPTAPHRHDPVAVVLAHRHEASASARCAARRSAELALLTLPA